MKKRLATLNIKIQWSDKLALLTYARSQGESVSVIVRKLIKEELIKGGFLHPINVEASWECKDCYSLATEEAFERMHRKN